MKIYQIRLQYLQHEDPYLSNTLDSGLQNLRSLPRILNAIINFKVVFVVT